VSEIVDWAREVVKADILYAEKEESESLKELVVEGEEGDAARVEEPRGRRELALVGGRGPV
jgi:hypothetical protein